MWMAALLWLLLAGDAKSDPVIDHLASLQPRCGNSESEYLPHYVVLHTWPGGAPKTIAAGYFDGSCERVLTVFRISRGGRFRALATSTADPYQLALLDFTGNGVPEIVVTEHPGRYARLVILHWDGVRLEEIGDTYDLAQFIDLDHDGVLEIIEPSHSGDGPAEIKRLWKGRYVSVKGHRLYGVYQFDLYDGGTQRSRLPTWLGGTRARVRIVNGLAGGDRRVERIEIALPGRPPFLIASGTDAFAGADVQLPKGEVQLHVRLDGEAGATLTLLVEKP